MAAEETTAAELQRLLDVKRQPCGSAARQASGSAAPPHVMVQLLLANEDDLVAAVTADFGVRPREVTRFADVLMALEAFGRAGRRPELVPARAAARRLPLTSWARRTTEYQPKGVVGVVAPWNYPIMLLLTPVASAFAAGDAVLLEAELAGRRPIAQLINDAYDESIARVVLGGPQTSAALPAPRPPRRSRADAPGSSCARARGTDADDAGARREVPRHRREGGGRTAREARRPRQDFEFRADLPRAGLRLRRG